MEATQLKEKQAEPPVFPFTIDFCSLDKSIATGQPGLTLLQHAILHRVPHMMECGGNGQCTTCRVRILDGLNNVTPRNHLEARLAKRRNWDPSIRLSCQTTACGPVKVF